MLKWALDSNDILNIEKKFLNLTTNDKQIDNAKIQNEKLKITKEYFKKIYNHFNEDRLILFLYNI